MSPPDLHRRRWLTGLGGTALLTALPLPSQAAPEAKLWSRWTAHTPKAGAEPDHSPWGRFLETYVKTGPDGINRVAYAEVTHADRDALKRYLDDMAGVVPADLNRDAQFAFWANLYNALTVKTVLAHYPVESIRDIDISPGWFADGPWGKKLITVDGAELSLDDIEHRILRPIWRDPRVHYAVNCAALGCPNLQVTPWRARDLKSRLDAAARAYVNHPRGVTLRGDGKLVLSSIYDWFREDFGSDTGGLIAHLRRHATPDLVAALTQDSEIAAYRYDWALNDAKAAPTSGAS
mgnify:CR=1 FL=1